jgi:DNA polymerase (family 10)
VIEAAARTGTMLEINAAPDRRDLDEIHAREAARAGVRILIDSDAHSTVNLRLLSSASTPRGARGSRRTGRQHPPWAEFRKLRKRERSAAN